MGRWAQARKRGTGTPQQPIAQEPLIEGDVPDAGDISVSGLTLPDTGGVLQLWASSDGGVTWTWLDDQDQIAADGSPVWTGLPTGVYYVVHIAGGLEQRGSSQSNQTSAG